jgi:hypothetical protein
MDRIDPNDLGEHHVKISLPRLQLSDRRRDFRWRKHGRRDLIEQRLEDVMISPIDQNHIRIGTPKRLSRSRPGEAGANDHDPQPANVAAIADR